MINYNKKMVDDYICGNDIEEYEIDDLENDYEFMSEVIKKTADKKIYNLCSDSLKVNYRFVKLLIELFEYDIDFICHIADRFLENNDDTYNRMELILNMTKICKDKDEEKYLKYSVMAHSIYLMMRTETEVYKEKNKDNQEIIDRVGIGFYMASYTYSGNDAILDYFAEKMIEEIIYDQEDFDFEKMLHENFSSFETIEKNGINNFIINFLNSYDIFLSSYVSKHLNTLTIIKEKLKRIKANWNNFNNINETNRYEIITEAVDKYVAENDFSSFFCYVGESDGNFFGQTDILYYIANELGFLEQIRKQVPNDYSDWMLIDYEKFELNSLRHFLNIKKIVSNILKEKIVSERDECETPKTKKYSFSGTKIVEFKVNKQ